ncbi:hypothetical protein BABAYKA_00010 [Brevundimonas phage vB_BpoS-Babayka]|uniref:Uncharacterized protein n=1 Tax=Brevundimonas phage vB_BpoS-Babayka TaxID=2948596 RepID=A0A9E7MVB9_9CAUD|nr:hypothetical protein BABAYKA_00010 [Brevundimonas phage vB_BpoS-Babayka]
MLCELVGRHRVSHDLLGQALVELLDLWIAGVLRLDQRIDFFTRHPRAFSDQRRASTVSPLEREDLGLRPLAGPLLHLLRNAEAKGLFVGDTLLLAHADTMHVQPGLKVEDQLLAVREDRLDIHFQRSEVRLDHLAISAEAANEHGLDQRLTILRQVLQVGVRGREAPRNRGRVVQHVVDDAIRLNQRQHTLLLPGVRVRHDIIGA